MRLIEKTGAIFSALYRRYRFEIYPKVSDFRGTTRLYRVLESLSTLGIEKIDENPEHIYNKEWNDLIILDSCRHDTYEKTIGGEDEFMLSVAGNSPDFITRTFSEGDFSDTVLITGNPHFNDEIFHNLTGREVSKVFHDVFRTYKTDWNEDENTVLPEPIMRDAQTADKLYPDRKKIIWFMQPHYPFISSERSDINFLDAVVDDSGGKSIWSEAMIKGGSNEIIEDYEGNLNYVFPYAEELARNLKGKTVITSDHGNFLGENGLWGHSMGDSEKVLRKVPYKEVEE